MKTGHLPLSLITVIVIVGCTKNSEGSTLDHSNGSAVQMGLSVKWASCNVGASNPWEYGGYYQWAGITDVASISSCPNWENCPYHTGSSPYSGWTKYVPSSNSSHWSGSGSPDNETVLHSEDDVAHVKLGKKWRMPTDAEWTELRENCIWTWTDNYNGTGVPGMIVTSKKSGYTNKSIFLPAAGVRDGFDLLYEGSEGCYWSSTLSREFSDYGYMGGICIDGPYKESDARYRGLSVRPVSQ